VTTALVPTVREPWLASLTKREGGEWGQVGGQPAVQEDQVHQSS